MKKLILTILFLGFVFNAQATEVISQFDDDGLVVLNDTLQTTTTDIKNLEEDIATLTTSLTTVNAITVDGYDTSTTAVASKIPVMGTNGYLPDASVDTTALKTTTGEVTGSGTINVVLPGGTYGFYPQVKCAANLNIGIVFATATPIGSTYVTSIAMSETSGYAQQRYVTASGEDLWIFLLIDKVTKDIVGSYQAPDHPAYGNGGNFDKLPHPFGKFDESKYEVVLIDKETASLIKSQATEERSILMIINEDYKSDFSSEKTYQPLHSGKFINKDNKQIKQMVTSIPSYIKVRGLVKLTDKEKENKQLIKEATKIANQHKIEKKQQDRMAGLNKLKVLGLKDEEIEALVK